MLWPAVAAGVGSESLAVWSAVSLVLIGAALFYYSLTLPLAVGINALERRQRIIR